MEFGINVHGWRIWSAGGSAGSGVGDADLDKVIWIMVYWAGEIC